MKRKGSLFVDRKVKLTPAQVRSLDIGQQFQGGELALIDRVTGKGVIRIRKERP